MIREILYVFFTASLFGLFWAYAGYSALIWILARLIGKRHRYDEAWQPNISVIIPTFNDEVLIEEKLKNISQLNYPKEKLEIIIVNDCSSDATQHIIEEIVKSSGAENFRLINHSRRSGNNAARNTGLKSATNDIVAFTDANAFLDKEALRYCAGHFSDRRVGCVAARYVKKIMIKSGESIGASFYHRIQGAKYKNEAEIGCAHTSQGYLQLFRKDLLDPGEKRISAVDMDMTLSVKEKGYEVVYEPRAIACKLPAATKKDLFIQMRRTLVGVIICIFKYRSLLNPFRHGFLSICFFSNRAIQLLTPFFIFLLVFSSYGIYILQPSRLFYYLIFLEMIAFFIGLTAVSLPQTKEITIQPFPVIKFFVLMNVFCLVAWRDFLKGDYNPIWTPIRTTRIRSQDLTNL